MRFGRNFPTYQIPRWAGFYVKYDKWKVLAKAANFEGLGQAVARDCLVVEKFLDNKNEFISRHLSILNDEYGITLESWKPESLHYMRAYEKDDITAALADISSLLVDLSDYTSVTQCAVSRIKAKITDRLYDVEGLREILGTADTRWIRYLEGINAILQTLHYPSNLPNESVSSLSLSNFGSSEIIHILKEAVDALEQDPPGLLMKRLQYKPPHGLWYTSQLILILIKIGILSSSHKYLPFLISKLSTTNYIPDPHASPDPNPLRVYVLHATRLEDKLVDQEAHQGVQLILRNLPSGLWSGMLLCPDSLGRLPLHYATQHGMTATCSEMIECLESVVEPFIKDDLPIFLIPDRLGETPLSISIAHGHAEILQLFLHRLRPSKEQPSPHGAESFEGIFYDLISLAIRSRRTYIANILVECEITLGSKMHDLLYLASQYGQKSIVGRLLTYVININVGNPLRGRTPLMVASIYEHIDVVQMLLAHPSCDVGFRDHDGWTAVDHAAFKGLLDIVKMLQGQRSRSYHPSPEYIQCFNLSAHRSKMRNRASTAIELDRQTEGRSHIFMNLGHFDMEKDPLILQIDPFRQLVAPMQIPDSSLILEILPIDCEAPKPYFFSFPILEDLSNDPLYFTTTYPDAAKFQFKVYSSVLRQNPHTFGPLIGSAVVSLRALRQGLSPSLESLERDHTVSLVSSDAFDNQYAGTLTFTFVLSTPFVFPGPLPAPSELVLRRDDSPLIAGHRGHGENNARRDHLQLGENTMDSFLAALDLGADILEFGKPDLTPVIYHDFLVSETGTDAPMHTLTYEQFMAPSTMQDRTTRPLGRSDSLLRAGDPKTTQRPRSSSEGELCLDNVDLIARLKSSFNFQRFGFKGNIGGECIHGQFTTLQQLLMQIDVSVCFDIELKYPMLFEARDFNMNTFAMELNLYLDTILEIVFRHGRNRPIFFSSFSPELCMLLAAKQNIYPVLFLTESGYIPTRDIRALSFQEAVRFAKKWNLEGVVVRSQPIMASPMLVDLVKSQGLVCASWGDLNDDPESAKIQADAHLDVFITNRVGKVVRALNRRREKPVGPVP
ncbi:Glycerophosphoryl diester phosphodiesterase family-domain-containing protein [Nemania abortiva]|nr:Glycerophosphoryl diester phosphodiesterase family-domain-containing protein [Nemania abortiva]